MNGAEFRRLALALDGTKEVPHFERRAFKVRRIFATLAPGEETANLLLTPLKQEHWCALLPEAFSPVPNKWGARGWTSATLAQIDGESLSPALRGAWANDGGTDVKGRLVQIVTECVTARWRPSPDIRRMTGRCGAASPKRPLVDGAAIFTERCLRGGRSRHSVALGYQRFMSWHPAYCRKLSAGQLYHHWVGMICVVSADT
jgi:hypothetical protein